MTSSGLDLRELVASVVKEMVGDLVKDAVRDTVHARTPPTNPHGIGTEFVTANEPGARTETVRITDDGELDQFARLLLALFENPKNRQDLRAGRLTFRLAKAPVATAGVAAGQATRIERGAVTERHVVLAAEAGHRIILGRRAVLTPLGREKARALNVPLEKER